MGTQVSNSPLLSGATEPHSIIMRIVRTGHWLLYLSDTSAGMENPTVHWTAFESCNNLSFKGVTWQQKNGWLF